MGKGEGWGEGEGEGKGEAEPGQWNHGLFDCCHSCRNCKFQFAITGKCFNTIIRIL